MKEVSVVFVPFGVRIGKESQRNTGSLWPSEVVISEYVIGLNPHSIRGVDEPSLLNIAPVELRSDFRGIFGYRLNHLQEPYSSQPISSQIEQYSEGLESSSNRLYISEFQAG